MGEPAKLSQGEQPLLDPNSCPSQPHQVKSPSLKVEQSEKKSFFTLSDTFFVSYSRCCCPRNDEKSHQIKTLKSWRGPWGRGEGGWIQSGSNSSEMKSNGRKGDKVAKKRQKLEKNCQEKILQFEE